MLVSGVRVCGKCDRMGLLLLSEGKRSLKAVLGHRCVVLLDVEVSWLNFSSNREEGREVILCLAGLVPHLLYISERCNYSTVSAVDSQFSRIHEDFAET